MASTVLIVEDESVLRTPIAKILRRRGFQVLEAGDGCLAIELYRDHFAEIDIVLLDMTLPGKCGADVLAELEQIRPDVRVILTSAWGAETVTQSLRGQQPWGYIRKPYASADLIDLLHSAAPGARSRSATS